MISFLYNPIRTIIYKSHSYACPSETSGMIRGLKNHSRLFYEAS